LAFLLPGCALAYFPTDKASDDDVFAYGGNVLVQQILDSYTVLANVCLAQQAHVVLEFL
jgi:hypothetical protein